MNTAQDPSLAPYFEAQKESGLRYLELERLSDEELLAIAMEKVEAMTRGELINFVHR